MEQIWAKSQVAFHKMYQKFKELKIAPNTIFFSIFFFFFFFFTYFFKDMWIRLGDTIDAL